MNFSSADLNSFFKRNGTQGPKEQQLGPMIVFSQYRYISRVLMRYQVTGKPGLLSEAYFSKQLKFGTPLRTFV